MWSDFIERIRHRSSTHSAMCGNRSLTSRAALAVRRELPLRPLEEHLEVPLAALELVDRDRSCRASANSFGLGSNESTCDTPPLMYRKMTRFAFGGKCGGLRRERIGGRGAAVLREQLRHDARQQQRAADQRARACRGGSESKVGRGWSSVVF